MSYNHRSIRDVIEKISSNAIYLPAIQRRFVWSEDQIRLLFDSLMKGYPIGSFLFWEVGQEDLANYSFYKFIQEYHERDNFLNETAPKPELQPEILAVLDGQQRLSSMFVALQGSYAYRTPYGRWDKDESFPRRHFYLNLLYTPSDDDSSYGFRFLTDEESHVVDPTQLWFDVRQSIVWGVNPAIDEYYDSTVDKLEEEGRSEIAIALKERRTEAKSTLRVLHQRICIEETINYFLVKGKGLDDVLDIFVRVNSAGTVLSMTDLLFSTIVASWQEGRDAIETLLKTINEKGEGFDFGNDFIMRSCLAICDLPVLFKVKGFRHDNVLQIKAAWESISGATEKMVDLLVEFGFNRDNLTSQNAVIPISYYIAKGGDLSNPDKRELQKYLINVLLKKTFGAQTDSVLSAIRESMRESNGKGYLLKNKKFQFSVLNHDFEGKQLKRDLAVSDEDMEELLTQTKGPYTFMILSMLYPQLKYGQVLFHQDHIHPRTMFTDTKMRRHGVEKDSWPRWKEMRDQLPNLQLLEGQENLEKHARPFKDWIEATIEDQIGRKDYCGKHYIAPDANFSFDSFEPFFTKRKELLRKKIKKVLS